MLANQSGTAIQILRTYIGTEFVNKIMDQILKETGMIHQTSSPHTPEQNGMAARMNRTLIQNARCLQAHSNLSKNK